VNLTGAQARARFSAARVAHLATAGRDGQPHIVPITFAIDGPVTVTVTAATIVTAVDHKPKTTTRLRRLRNIAENPRVALLADAYSDDWSQLWWARADGTARIIDAGHPEHAQAIALLADRYPQYRERPPSGPVIAVAVAHWSGWVFAADGVDDGAVGDEAADGG
jgi:PPOX class probable F420-dependent enzyme